MSEKDNGGSAFPSHGSMGEVAHQGMTMRDYFAAKAMQGIWSNTDILKHIQDGNEAGCIAAMAYEQADAMLKARQQ